MEQTAESESPPVILIVGAGGIASYLMPVLIRTRAKLFPDDDIMLMDADTLEERNLDRQLFTVGQIGMNKAEALADRLDAVDDADAIGWATYYIQETSVYEHWFPENLSTIICCADNHPARVACLSIADQKQVPVFIGANELFQAEAYVYSPNWKGTPADPRVRYPEILTDRSGDPIACQGEQQEAHPQLALANHMAASLLMQLLWNWLVFRNEGDPSTVNFLPYEYTATHYRVQTLTLNQDERINTD